MSKEKSGKKELGILIGIVVLGVAIFAGVQLYLNSVADGGFSKAVPYISADEFFEKVDNKEDFVVIYGSETCSACTAYKPTVASTLKMDKYKDVKVYYFDANSASEEDRNRVSSYLGAQNTPTTFIFNDGIIFGSVEGNVPETELQDLLNLHMEYKK